MTEILCWHRMTMRKKLMVCMHCGVLVEECPCVRFRVPDGSCICCSGSGWVAILRGHSDKFLEYVERHA